MRIATLLLVFALTACEAEQADVTLVHLWQEPAPGIARKVKDTLESRGIPVVLREQRNWEQLTDEVLSGRADLAIIEEPAETIGGLTTIAPLYPSVLHVLVPDGTGSRSFADAIRGRTIWAGPEGGTDYRLLTRVAADAGVDPAEFTLLSDPWTITPDIHFTLGGLLRHQDAAELAPYELFNFAMPTDVERGSFADAIALRHHDVRPFLLPRGTYPDLADDAVTTLSIRSILVASESIDDNLAFDIADALFTNAQDISREYPLVTRELDEGFKAAQLMLPLHGGSRRYIDRDGPGFIERYVEVLALYFTVIVTLLSGGFALYRYRSRVKKDRLDRYYGKLIAVREAMPAKDPAASKSEVLAVQREVLDLLIDERVTADASLTAFISLSNQLVDELDRQT